MGKEKEEQLEFIFQDDDVPDDVPDEEYLLYLWLQLSS